MYRVLGADGQQYGPASVEAVRRWLAEGRLNGQSLLQLEGTTEWKGLATFAEFAPDPRCPPPLGPLPPPPGQMPNPRASNKLPAGICGIVLGSLGVHKFILGYTGPGLIMLLVSVLSCGLASPVMHVIGLIEGIIYLTKSDDEFVRTYVDARKEWF
jgi:TM2 domain-containing membrane protein YozV